MRCGVDGDSEVELDRLTDTSVRLWLPRGVAALRVRSLDEDESVEIGTEAGVLEVLRPGSYRVEADERDGDTLVTVRAGLAEFSVEGRSLRVHAGETLRMSRGDAADMRVSSAFAEDAFDRWCQQRDERLERSVGSRYLPSDIVGYEDLDGYGNWEYASDYGYVWFPTAVEPGWTPYAFGSWVWVGPWGWTWIDSSPWGYAPYHYGRWARYHDRWCWVPGPRNERPRYAPAPEGWRRAQPLLAGDGRVYRPPAPPREMPARGTRSWGDSGQRDAGHPRDTTRSRDATRSRDDRRISFPERPLNAAPQAPSQHREPYGGRPPGSASATPGVVTPDAAPSSGSNEPARSARPDSTDSRWRRDWPGFRRDQQREPGRQSSPVAQPTPAPQFTPPSQSPPVPRSTAAPREMPAPRWAPAPGQAPARPVVPAPVPVPAPQQAPQQQAPQQRQSPQPQQAQQSPPAPQRSTKDRDGDSAAEPDLRWSWLAAAAH